MLISNREGRLRKTFSNEGQNAAYGALIKDKPQIRTIVRMAARGNTFKGIVGNLMIMREEFEAPQLAQVYKGISEAVVQRSLRINCAMSLQTSSDIMKKSWIYSIATDAGTILKSAYIDIRIWAPFCASFVIFHLLAIPLRDGENEFVSCSSAHRLE